MSSILFGLTSAEKELLNQPTLSFMMVRQLTSLASSLAPAAKLKKNIYKSKLPPFSDPPPRYFSRGAKESPLPLFQLLTETNELPQHRPIPRNRLLLRTLCRGKGVLRQSQGHVYLDIDNHFILGLLPYLRSQGLVRAPYFNLFGSPNGAHIPVIPSREAYFQDLDSIREVGKECSFEIEGLYSMAHPTAWPEIEEVWFFKVKSSELEQVRRNYFLPPSPGGHPFIIAIAVKPASLKQDLPLSIHRISPSIHVA